MPLARFVDILDEVFRTYHHRRYVQPDPLQFLYSYEDPLDREVVALVASSLAYGRVAQILKSVTRALEPMGTGPRRFVTDSSPSAMRKAFRGFRHRFNDGDELAALLSGLAKVLRRYGSLGRCLEKAMHHDDPTVQSGLEAMVAELHEATGGPWNHLLCDVDHGSACKRLNLMLRWMVRCDEVDVGGWDEVPPAKLLVPLDTHMHGLCRSMGATQRNQTDMRTVMEVTEAFRAISPNDPVRYDFSLTRLGIRDEFREKDFLKFFESRADPKVHDA